MTHDFIYGIRPSHGLTQLMQQSQLSMMDSPAGPIYPLDAVLKNEIILAHTFPEGYEPLKVGLCMLEDVAGKLFFNVYQVPNGLLTITPTINLELSDTQFSDVTQEVSVARTAIGAIMNAFENIESPEINHDRAFVAASTVLTFGFTVKTNTGGHSQQPYDVVGYGKSIGRVSLEEVMDDPDNYDTNTYNFVNYLVAQQKEQQA